MRWFSRFSPSLVTRLTAAFAALGLLPVGLLAYRLIDVNKAAMSEQVESTQALFSRNAAEQVTAFVNTQMLLAQSLAGNAVLADPRSPAAQTLLSETLRAWTRLGVLAIAMVDTEGRQALLVQIRDEATRKRVTPVLQAGPGQEVLGFPGSPFPLLRVSADLPGEIGFVWVVADGQALFDALDFYEYGQGSMKVALTTREGTDLVGSSKGFPPELIEKARTLWLQGTELAIEPSTEGEKWLGSYAPVAGTDWLVLSRQPSRIAYQVARDMTRQAWVAVALVGLAVTMLSALAYISVVKPMRELAGAQRRLAGLSPKAGGGSEIDQLKNSFEALERRMKEQGQLDEVFLGRYQVLDVLGTGAMGTVFLGRDPKLERKLAIKTVRLGRGSGAEKQKDLLERLLQEATITAQFNHPNIVSVYDVQDSGDAAFVAMEFVDGTNLEQLVWKQGRLSPDQVVFLGAAVARGLEAAHTHDLVHRDVKPANILLGRDGSIKVTDFGIAEILSSVAPAGDVVFGTPGYLPPEALRGERYEANGDLFSLGAVLYFCLTGSRAFEGKTLKEVVRKTLFGIVERPSASTPDIPARLDSLVMDLLSTRPGDRPASATRVAEELEAISQQLGAHWQLSEEVFLSEGTSESEAAYLPTTPMAVGD
ncbi:MAG: serine/threonine protein kinase [Acidobacteriota bacterium]|nr:serine/threonine protein kinase [Acidobacteriota bacterium]